MNSRYDDEPDEDWDADLDDDSDSETITCPYCRADVYEDVERCPNCEQYLSREEIRKSSQPLWVVVTATGLLLLFLWMLVRGWL